MGNVEAVAVCIKTLIDYIPSYLGLCSLPEVTDVPFMCLM